MVGKWDSRSRRYPGLVPRPPLRQWDTGRSPVERFDAALGVSERPVTTARKGRRFLPERDR